MLAVDTQWITNKWGITTVQKSVSDTISFAESLNKGVYAFGSTGSTLIVWLEDDLLDGLEYQ